MQISHILAIASGVAYTLAYLDYNRQVIKGATKPNGATWLIWSVVSAISTTSYLKMSGDVWKSVIPLLNIGLCIATFTLAVYLKKFKWPDKWDFVALLIGVIAAVVWKHYGSAKYANLIVQFAILAGFIPMWRALTKKPTAENPRPWECEQPRPWLLWVTSYVLATIVVFLRWNNQWCDLVYQVNCVLLHSSVPLLGVIMRRINHQPKTKGKLCPP